MKALLPPALQWEGKATGKTARMTFTTLAVNNGVENLITAAATKHRDPKTMMGYVKPNVQTFTGAAIGIGSALKKQRRHVDGDDDGNTGMHFLANACSSSSFHTGSQDQGALSRFQQASGPPFHNSYSSSSTGSQDQGALSRFQHCGRLRVHRNRQRYRATISMEMLLLCTNNFELYNCKLLF
jgi:hypothetical protein